MGGEEEGEGTGDGQDESCLSWKRCGSKGFVSLAMGCRRASGRSFGGARWACQVSFYVVSFLSAGV